MKKVLCLILAVTMLLACIPAVSAVYGKVSDWAKKDVESMSQLGFLPECLNNADLTQKMTRGEMCHMVVLIYNDLLGIPGTGADLSSKDPFTDTNDPVIKYAEQEKLVGGYPDKTFRPNDLLTRQDFCKIIYNMMEKLFCKPAENERGSLDQFWDGSSVSNYAVEATQAMVGIGVVNGLEGNQLRPLAYTSREQAVVMLFRAYQYLCDQINKKIEAQKDETIENLGYENISPWAVQEVMEMQMEGLIPEFMKGADMTVPISREQMCSIAMLAYNKAMKTTYKTSKVYFSDSDNPDVSAAYELGLVNGVGGGKFNPRGALEREQFFKIMGKFMNAIGYSKKDINSVKLDQFVDTAKLSSWAVVPTKMMVYSGTIRGDGNKLNPHGQTTNEEALAVFLRCYRYVVAWTAMHPHGEESNAYEALIGDVIAFAKSFKGYPYVYGGNGPNSFDCSGFVLYVYRHFGYSFSRGAEEQFMDGQNKGYAVSNSKDLRPGDLVFFSNSKGVNISNSSFRSINHVGLYLGDGEFIHASNPTRGVVIDKLFTGYYSNHFWGGCHVVTEKDFR